MSNHTNRIIAIWLFSISAIVIVMIILGGLVRLTRSGLSIVEWNVITGVIPPMSQEAWETEFAKYQESPEYQKINYNMTLSEYEFIYYMEYAHRLLGRIVGLAFVLPLFYFLVRRTISLKKSFPFFLIGLGFAFQGWLGWYMVASGLVDRPAVSHFRLTAHFLAALTLLGLAFWVGLDFAQPAVPNAEKPDRRLMGLFSIAGLAFLIQISYGGLVAGLKAGFISNTWPLMAGRFLPPGMFQSFDSWLENLVSEMVTVHFIHRCFSFAVLLLVTWIWLETRRRVTSRATKAGARWLVGLCILQILLGISVVLFSVPISLASLHQTVAISIFLAGLFFAHTLVRPQAV